ncbi:MAG: hypothetical protein HYZ23_04350 [Chloroflexi bacterium]|nr:hypothetical protein [Chloroflexota bacterium]
MTESISTATYCYVHPGRETSLRCKRCERYICASCAQRTPTGYLCKECVSQHKKIFDTAFWYDYLTGFGVTFILSLIASGILAFVSAFIGFYMIFVSFAIAGGAGVFISNITLRATGKRRSRNLFILCAMGVVLGALPIALFQLYIGDMFSLIMLGIYAAVAAYTVYARISGIQL